MLEYLWQLPQNLIGLCIYLFHKYICKHELLKVRNIDGIEYYYAKHVANCGISLGKYIFLDSDRSLKEKSVRHEYGHQLQSKKYGWLYLIVVGLPSVIGNLIDRYKKIDYYSLPWEKEADKLGGVYRNE